jgi:recombination protein RecA
MPINMKPGSKPLPKPIQVVQAPAPLVAPEDVAEKPAAKASELATLLNQFRKDKGEKSVMVARNVPDVRRIATGLFEFDLATGGGFPRGRYSIIYGPESSCKSNLALEAVAEAQRGPAECNKVVWIDLEHTFDPKWAVLFGVDIDALIILKPGYGEEAVDMADAVVRADDVALVVVDSLAVVVSSAEIARSVETAEVGGLVNKITIALSQEAKRDHDPAVIFINQTRFKIGVKFGNPETMPGGQTMKFLSSLTIRVSGSNVMGKTDDKPTFKHVDARIVKAKVGIVRSNFEFDMAMQPVGDIGVGESKSWNMVKGELASFGLLTKGDKGNGWVLDGKTYSLQSQIEDTYLAEKSFAIHLQGMVIKQYAGQKFIVDDTAKVEDGVKDEQGEQSVPGPGSQG